VLSAAVVATTLLLGAVPSAHAVAPTAGLPSAAGQKKKPVTTTAPQVRSCPLRFGVGTAGGPMASAELAAVGSLAGEAPSIVLSYKDFQQAPPIAELDAVRARGATTLLTWEPWTWGGGTEQPAYALDRITAGDHDEHLRRWGRELAAWGHPVMLRFGHEMNGNWYPWAEGLNGNGAGDYTAAWRHVHDVLVAEGAGNVTWVWNPNVPYWGSTPLDGLYPGADYVDAVALDGYNWGTSQSWSTWTAPEQLFGEGLTELRRIAPGKPVLVAETSSAEAGGSKAEWNRRLVAYLAAQPDVTALVWFHLNKEVDWRINSSATSADALKQGLSLRPCPS
jgi:beta-mannanase